MKKIFILAFVVFGLFSCKKNLDFGPQYENENPQEIEKVFTGVLIVNEGNFGFGNASLSVIDFQKQSIQNNVFQNVNNRKLGDVGQSVLVIDSLAFVVINNSNVIYVMSTKDFKLVKELKVSGAPRYLVKYKNEVLVSSMGSNSLVSFSLIDFSISTKIQKTDWGWLEEMQVVENKLFACNRTKNTIDVIDLEKNSIVAQIKVGQDPESLIQDSLGNIWALCTGGFDKNDREKASIYKLSKGNDLAELVYQFPDIENSPTRFRLSKNGNNGCFLNNGVFEFNLLNRGEPVSKFAQKSGQLFYGLGVNPSNGNLLIGNAKDYVTVGEILELNENGSLIQSYPAGIIPQAFGFY